MSFPKIGFLEIINIGWLIILETEIFIGLYSNNPATGKYDLDNNYLRIVSKI